MQYSLGSTSHRGDCASGMQGFSLVYVVIALMVVASLATITMSVTTTTQFGQLREQNTMQAKYMAMAGVAYLNSTPTKHRKLKGSTFEVKDASDNVVGEFTYTSIQRLDTLQVRAGIVGTVGKDTPREANYYMEGMAQEDFSGLATSNQDDFDAFTVTNSNPNVTGTDKVDGTDDISYAGRAKRGSATAAGEEVTGNEQPGPNAFNIGNNETNNFGIATFTGNRTFKYNTCVDGECDFFLGMRFFMTVWYDKNDADGLVITVFNGDNNTNKAIGGDTQHGEMIGYGGDSRVVSNTSVDSYKISKFIDPEANGIQPPKLGVEIDNYGNQNRYICSSSDKSHYWFRKTAPTSGTRYDYGGGSAGTGTDHVAFVGWGMDMPWGCAWYNKESTSKRQATSGAYANEAGAKTYDDNQHGRESWMWNPWQYQYSIDNANNELQLQLNDRRAVAQTFYVEEPLRIAQAHLYLRAKAGTTSGRALSAAIYNTTTSGGARIPTGSALITSRTSNDAVTDQTLPTGTGGTSECIYGDGTAVLVSFQFTDLWNHADSVVLQPGWYALVLNYGSATNHSDLYVKVDDSSPTHPGNYAYINSSNAWVPNTGIDLPFYVLFDPPNTMRSGKLQATNANEDFYSSVFPVVDSTSYDNGKEAQGNVTGWKLLGQRLAIRVEIHRGIGTDPDATITDNNHGSNSAPYHPYRMIVWMRRCMTTNYYAGCDRYLNTYFSDTSGDLSTEKNPPAMERTFYMKPADHNKFDTFFLGISEATGGSIQNARFDNIVMQFREPDDVDLNERACEYCNDFD